MINIRNVMSRVENQKNVDHLRVQNHVDHDVQINVDAVIENKENKLYGNKYNNYTIIVQLLYGVNYTVMNIITV